MNTTFTCLTLVLTLHLMNQIKSNQIDLLYRALSKRTTQTDKKFCTSSHYKITLIIIVIKIIIVGINVMEIKNT